MVRDRLVIISSTADMSITIVRCIQSDNKIPCSPSPFMLSGARNVFLETIKRAEDDDFTKSYAAKKTVVLRLYEAFGGHAYVKLTVGNGLVVSKATLANLLEDSAEELSIASATTEGGSTGDYEISLKFRAFEVKTVKLVIGDNPARQATLLLRCNTRLCIDSQSSF